MSMISDIKTVLEEQGFENPIYLANMPDSPDDCIGIYQYAGRSPFDAAKIERPGLQLLARSADYETAMDMMQTASDALCEIGDEINETLPDGVEIKSTLYLRITPVQSAFVLGKDENGRYEIVQNFYVLRRRN